MRPRTDTRLSGRRAHGLGNARSRHIAVVGRLAKSMEAEKTEKTDGRRQLVLCPVRGTTTATPQPVTLLEEGLGLLGLLGLPGALPAWRPRVGRDRLHGRGFRPPRGSDEDHHEDPEDAADDSPGSSKLGIEAANCTRDARYLIRVPGLAPHGVVLTPNRGGGSCRGPRDALAAGCAGWNTSPA